MWRFLAPLLLVSVGRGTAPVSNSLPAIQESQAPQNGRGAAIAEEELRARGMESSSNIARSAG